MAQGNSFLQADKVAAARISFNTKFNAAWAKLSEVPVELEQLAMEVPSDNAIEQYNWMGMAPAFKKWAGERQLSKLRNQSFQVVNEDFANGIEVDENDVDDDKLGIYAPKIGQLAEMAKLHKANLIVQTLLLGFSGSAAPGPFRSYDGKYFFDTTHQDANETAQSNLQSGALSVSTYEAAFAKMLGFTDENGEPINAYPTHLVVGPSNRALGKQILEAQYTAVGTTFGTNVEYQSAKLVISKKLVGTYAGYWFLTDLAHEVKPVIWQTRRPVQFRSVVGADSVDRFKRRVLYFGADGRYATAPGMWQYAVGSTG